ncbi:hypothetical protein [Mesorhizobium sp. AR10]|uniref:hypothetical protein n=1 Tax=Mesorhizobium sp. AR10 TaxID=2865839 RepID=UPI00215F535C|nr:hypothetical protein [Mesorhizobium sp. AR10]
MALTDTVDLRRLVDEMLAECREENLRLSLVTLDAEMRSHGLGLAHTHVRLNATQVHNAIRSQVGLVTSPSDPTHRRSYLAAVNDLLNAVEPRSVSYGSILSEDASARRLFMIVAQMVKHIDAATPVHFLIAETESGFTLLAAQYFARLFGGPHFRAYVERLGRLTIPFGFSDSGRYLGQMGATAPPNCSTTARSRSHSPITTAMRLSSKPNATILQQPASARAVTRLFPRQARAASTVCQAIARA